MATLRMRLQQFHRFDQAAGRLLGANDITEADITVLALKVLVVGGGAALLQCMFYIIYSLQNPIYTGMAQVGYGLLIYVLARFIYKSLAFALALIIELGALLPVAFVTGALGVDPRLVLQAMPTFFTTIFGVLIAVEIIETVFHAIARAFYEKPGPEKLSVRQMRKRNLLTPEERAHRKTVATNGLRIMLISLALFTVGLFLAFAFKAYLILAPSLIPLGVLALKALQTAYQLDRHEAQIFERLLQEGAIKAFKFEVIMGYGFNEAE